jgi:hypothetical protein
LAAVPTTLIRISSGSQSFGRHLYLAQLSLLPFSRLES